MGHYLPRVLAAALIVLGAGGGGAAAEGFTAALPPSAIVFHGLGSILAVDSDGRSLRRLVSAQATLSANPRFSPDGSLIAYVVDDDDGSDGDSLFVATSTGAHRRRLLARNVDSEFSWSPDSTRVAYTQIVATEVGDVITYAETVYVVNVETGARIRLSPGQQPRWSPVGEEIAIAGDGLVVVNALTGARRRVANATLARSSLARI